MSLLLEALKKAALEKQNKAEPEPPKIDEPLPKPNFADTIEQKDKVRPVLEPEPEQTESDLASPEKPTRANAEANTEQSPASPDLADTLAPASETAVSEDEELVFEPEFDDALEELDSSEVEHAPIPEFVLAEDETSSSLQADDLLDQAEIQAAKQQLEQEQQALELQRQKEAQEKQAAKKQAAENLKRDQEVRLANEQEQSRQAELAEQRRQQHVETEQKKQKNANRQALDQLIASGKEIRQKARRRSVFLYAALLLAAVGGLLSYYVYLTASSGRTELQTAGISEPNQQVAEVAEMLLAESNRNTTSDSHANPHANDATSESLTEQVPSNLPSSSASDIETGSSRLAPIEGQVGQLDTQDHSQNQDFGGESQGLISNSAVEVATRFDPPPSASAYLQPLILSANGSPQTETLNERVIIHHEAEPAPLNGIISEAYSALQSNQVGRAYELYLRALDQAPRQKDALLGAAAAATTLGNFNEATQFYQLRLEADPNDTYARAGLLGLATDKASRGTVLKEVSNMLRDHPELPNLHFLKGVGLAEDQNWQAAQSAFFEAYRLDNGNPDYAFNLAISLDHLGQPNLALTYYERALDLSNQRQPNFDPAAAQTRAAELSQP